MFMLRSLVYSLKQDGLVLKIRMFIFFFLCASGFSFSEELQTGSLLYINPKQPSLIILDGVEKGMSPLLLTDISRNSHTLQILGDSLYSEYNLTFNRNLSRITRLYPEGNPYYGFLNIHCSTEEANILLDGEVLSGSLSETLRLPEGEHQLYIEKEGLIPQNITVSIIRLETSNLDIKLLQEYRMGLPDYLPEGAIIQCSQGTAQKEIVYNGQSEIVLAEGEWNIAITHPLFAPVNIRIRLTDPLTLLEPELQYYQPLITLRGLEKGSQIVLNGTEVEVDEDKEDLEIPAKGGENLLLVTKPGYLDQVESILLEGDQIIDIDLSFAKDPQVYAEKRRTTGWIMIGTGLAMLSGGLYMNQDDVLISSSSNYQQYETMKYASLGVAGTGLLSILTGSGFLGAGIKGGNE